MSAQNPENVNTDLVTVTVSLNGAEMNTAYQLLSVKVTKAINRVTSAVLELLDGDAATGDFPLSDSSDFLPGTPIVVSAGYNSINQEIFSGIIIRHEIKARPAMPPLLTIECKDKAVKMTVGRKSATYLNMLDSDVISQLVSASGATATVSATTYQNKELVQYYCTDWDFMITRAEANGMIVTNDVNTVTVSAPALTSAVLELTYGDSVLSFDTYIDARSQYAGVQATSWSMDQQAILQVTASDPGITPPGNLSATTVAGVINSTYQLQSSTPLEQSDIQNWANASLLKSRLAMVRGSIKFQGNALALPGKTVTLAGMGQRFNGDAFVGGVYHEIISGNWTTTVHLGLEVDWFSDENRDIAAPPASGVLPGVSGFQSGTVKQIDSDPDNEFRVMVTIPLFNNQTVWARLANIYATSNAGDFFYPEIGDEVVLGFFNNDPRFPVILGSLYSSQKAPPFTPDAQNTNKGFVTKAQVKITVDDQNKIITLTTPGNNSMVISDQGQSITITDQNSNKIQMSSSGISIESASNLTLKASQNITMEATNNISVTATNGLTLKGMTVTGTANTEMKMSGTASAEFSASGQLAVKGAIVMIN